MQVFISWSGDRSRAVAELIRTWLKDVLQAVTPWMSDEDIEKGAVWFDVINTALAASGFGIICLTAEKQHAPWLLFEAGALAKGLEKSRVCPVCIDLEKTQVTGPLSLLNLAEAALEKDMRQLVKSINAQIPADRGQLTMLVLGDLLAGCGLSSATSSKRSWSNTRRRLPPGDHPMILPKKPYRLFVLSQNALLPSGARPGPHRHTKIFWSTYASMEAYQAARASQVCLVRQL